MPALACPRAAPKASPSRGPRPAQPSPGAFDSGRSWLDVSVRGPRWPEASPPQPERAAPFPPSREAPGRVPQSLRGGGGAPVVVSRCGCGCRVGPLKAEVRVARPRSRTAMPPRGGSWVGRASPLRWGGGFLGRRGFAGTVGTVRQQIPAHCQPARSPWASPAHIGMSRQPGLEQHLPGAQPPALWQARPAGPLASLGVLAHAARTPVRCPRGHFGCRTSR